MVLRSIYKKRLVRIMHLVYTPFKPKIQSVDEEE